MKNIRFAIKLCTVFVILVALLTVLLSVVVSFVQGELFNMFSKTEGAVVGRGIVVFILVYASLCFTIMNPPKGD